MERVPEVVPGFPDRIVARSAAADAVLKTRTLTNLYNSMPDWLRDAHADLDTAVAAAYGWPAGLSDGEVLRRLLDLNLRRAKAQRPAARRRFHWKDPRQFDLPFPPQQLGLPLDGGSAVAAGKRRKALRPRKVADRRQLAFLFVIPGRLRARVHQTIATRAEAA